MKRRIFLGLARIFILFVGIGSYAVWLVTRLGGAVDVTQTMFLVLVVGVGSALFLVFATQRSEALRVLF